MNEQQQVSQLPGDENKIKTYRTSDIYFSAFLCSLDISLLTTEMDKSAEGDKKVVFVFRIPEMDLQRIKSSYFGGTATVKARRFVDNIRSLKSMCFT
jgi:hypothetical protein